MRRVRILIADDHRLMLSAIRATLEVAGDFEVVAEAIDGSQVLPLVRSTSPHVVLLDLKMPRIDGLTCLEQLRSRYPEIQAIVLSAVEEPDVVRAAFRHGAAAYILKRINPVDLPGAIRQALDGTVYRIFPEPVDENPLLRETGLTDRELTVLRHLAEGMSNKQIGSSLYLAEQTVKFHLTSLYRKLNARSRTEAVREAYRIGLLDAPMLEQAV
jgi:DNA-binding NarL/FixJ family response regulator